MIGRRLLATLGLCLLPAGAASAQPRGVSMTEIFHGFLVGHLAAHREAAPDATYRVARTDLNGDNQPEMLVYLNDPIWCGPHGCDLLVFTADGDRGWRQLAEIGTGALPVMLLESRSRGWRDLSLYVSDSLAPGMQRRFAFDGTRYALAEDRPRGGAVGRPLITRDSHSHDLFKPWPGRAR